MTIGSRTPTHFARVRRLRVADAAMVAIAGALSVYALGIGTSLIIAGVGAVMMVLRKSRIVDAPLVAFVMALVINVTALFVCGIAAALLAPSAPFAVTARVILAIPLVVAAGTWTALRLRSGTSDVVPMRAGQYRYLGAVLIVATAGEALLKLKSTVLGVTWTMSNDASTHVYIARSIIMHDGITIAQLHQYPPLANYLAALAASAFGRGEAQPGALMIHDVAALAGVEVLIYAALVVALGTCVLLVRTSGHGDPSAATLYDYGFMAIAGVIVVTPLVAGNALAGGFLSGIAGVLMTVAAIAMAMHFMTSRSPVVLATASSAVVLAFLSWVLAGIALCPMLLVASVAGARTVSRTATRSSATRWSWMGVAAGFGVVLVIMLGVVVSRAALKSALVPGGFALTVLWWLLPLLTVIACVTTALLLKTPASRVMAMPASMGLGAVALLAVMARTNTLGHVSHYYVVKFTWLATSSLSWLPIAIIALVVVRPGTGAALQRSIVAVGLLASIVIVNGYRSALPQEPGLEPLQWIWDGGDFHNRTAFTQMATLSDEGHPVVFWDAALPIVEIQGLNYWSAQSFASVNGPGPKVPFTAVDSGMLLPPAAVDFRSWSANRYIFVRDGKPVSLLCELLNEETHVTVVTDNPALPATVRSNCPHLAPNVSRYIAPRT